MKQELSPTLRRVADRERKEGKVEGLKEGIVASILAILTTKFGDYPEELEIRIRQIKDQERLSNILVAAINAKSLVEYESSMDL